jgi:2-polyprenyl-6-hydroxyphenyl methylase/3-demethylubiquinone-9 3-methyltransferase
LPHVNSSCGTPGCAPSDNTSRGSNLILVITDSRTPYCPSDSIKQPWTTSLTKLTRLLHRLTKTFGTSNLRRHVWDKEFLKGQWEYLEHTSDDIIYYYLRKYSNHGSILDLGCGSGNTGNELAFDAYDYYLGVDISRHALATAARRSEHNQRASKNEYLCADILSYVPTRNYDLILFRESLFYVSETRIPRLLYRYSQYLIDGGVFIVRMCNRNKYKGIVRIIDTNFAIVEKYLAVETKAIVLVFQSLT